MWCYLQWPSGVSSLSSVSTSAVSNHYLKILSCFNFFLMEARRREERGERKLISRISVKGGHWRVKGRTKMASAERWARDRYLLKMSVSCNLTRHVKWGAFFVRRCPRLQKCPIWSPNKDLLLILPVHSFYDI